MTIVFITSICVMFQSVLPGSAVIGALTGYLLLTSKCSDLLCGELRKTEGCDDTKELVRNHGP